MVTTSLLASGPLADAAHAAVDAGAVAGYPAATGISSVAWLLLLLPAAGTVVLLVGGRRLDRVAPILGCLTVIVGFVIALSIFVSTTSMAAADRVHDVHIWSWIPVSSLQVDLAMHLDPLSLTFALLITGVGSLILIYSIGYMAHDPDRRVFFGYMNLFVTSMLLLVLGNSFVTTYFGWEGVGLASYLLIGFWSHKPIAATAAKKAFVMNRVGDVGFALAIFLMFKEFGTTDFAGVFAGAKELAATSPATVSAMGLLLLLGACGKSGQVPLQAWLPDAMEGPTPVSALIHAATMVTAGVYLICRSAPVYNETSTGLLAVAVVGAVTLLFGCIAGCAQDDFKRVLAYSTVSQIGYMFLAAGLGTGAYGLAILHLLSHGFFKADLFLSAGAVMHGMNDDVNMRHFGGLWRKMPITFATMSCGYLAIIGFPFLSGFYSKDPIIEAAFAAGGTKGWLLGLAALIGAGLTTFYMTRFMIMVFFGKPRWKELKTPDGRDYHPHEAPWTMLVPMILLSLGALGGGAFLAVGHRLTGWLSSPSFGPAEEPHPVILSSTTIEILSIAVMVIGGVIAYLIFGTRPVPLTAPATKDPVIRLARAQVGGDIVNEAVFAVPGRWMSRTFVASDDRGIDGIVDGFGTVADRFGQFWRRWQNGYVRSYALSMLSGALLVTVALMVVNFS